MLKRKITFARVRMLLLMSVIGFAIFGQIGGVERTAQCANCQGAQCPAAQIPCGPHPDYPIVVSCFCQVPNWGLLRCT